MKSYQPDYTKHLDQLLPLLLELVQAQTLTPRVLRSILNKYPREDHRLFSKDMIVAAYRGLAGTLGIPPFEEEFLRKIQMKPTRTISGVTPVTVLTKPFPCPGKCIFCPNDIRMPKSYLADEPGAQRAERNFFDPYLQTYNRLQAFHNTGHQVAKVELIILGGTWSYYPEAYQIWFIKECLRALNEFGEGIDSRQEVEQRYADMAKLVSNNPTRNAQRTQKHQIHGDHLVKSYNQTVSELYVAPERLGGFDRYQSASWNELFVQQRRNQDAACRNVGLVIETRPDNISEEEVIRVRKLGCTKTQIGFQSLQDDVLQKNHRGHDVAATRKAVNLLRQAGFKIHAHWMPNLYGSSVELDKQDYYTLFHDPDFKPDELKIYPCSLIESAELMQYYKRGDWQPYDETQLLDILTTCLSETPEYCRLTRVIRDIPSTDIVVGNKKTNFREVAQKNIERNGHKSKDIRAREIRSQSFDYNALQLIEVPYSTSVSEEIFLQFVVPFDEEGDEKIVAFLRLSLPTQKNFITELAHAAIIREVHVYGQTVGIGKKADGKAQHLGLGTQLIERAKAIAKQKGFSKLAVISAIGTRSYYRARGFTDGDLYQIADIV